MREVIGTKYITCSKIRGKTWYPVQKRIDGKTCHFGTGRTLIEALMIRDWCVMNNWEKSYPMPHSTGEKYIRKLQGYYCIQKIVNGKFEHFGSFKTLEDAVKERDLLIQCNWDFDALCEGLNEGNNWLTDVSKLKSGFKKSDNRYEIINW
ncbi:MAG: hypothetical protein IKF79_01605 [Methanosphaera sp.]|nr:hypothetical protein [Methanosphaera sp.]